MSAGVYVLRFARRKAIAAMPKLIDTAAYVAAARS
jgi:hypothetical protein